jgi:hypothetical protein
MANGRCRLHGGLSTGPKTAKGIERIRRANTKSGLHTKEAKEQRYRLRELLHEAHALVDTIPSRIAMQLFDSP